MDFIADGQGSTIPAWHPSPILVTPPEDDDSPSPSPTNPPSAIQHQINSRYVLIVQIFDNLDLLGTLMTSSEKMTLAHQKQEVYARRISICPETLRRLVANGLTSIAHYSQDLAGPFNKAFLYVSSLLETLSDGHLYFGRHARGEFGKLMNEVVIKIDDGIKICEQWSRHLMSGYPQRVE
jgi:hypothetical protein